MMTASDHESYRLADPAPGRKLTSWVDSFVEYTERTNSPQIFRRWSAITAIAGALEQRVWIRSQGADLYPNLYTFLVGPPGVGKSNALHECEYFWKQLSKHHVAPVSLTKPALMDALNEASRVINQTHIFNSLLIAVGELGALIPGYDVDFLNALTYLYDTRTYRERRRSIKEEMLIERPQINLLACCTPSFLTQLMPAGAWEQGFLARVIIIYSDESKIKPLNLSDDDGVDRSMQAALTHDLQAIGADEHYRKLKFTQAAADLIHAWHEGRDDKNLANEIDHPRLLHYKTRRTVHLLKLCMIANASRTCHDDISDRDFITALDWMVEAEKEMPGVFKAMASGGDAMVMNELHHYIIGWTTRKGKPIPAAHVYDWLRDRVTANASKGIVDLMERSGMVRQVIVDGLLCYWPKGKMDEIIAKP